MELAEVPDGVLLVHPVRPFLFLAKAALKVMTELCEEAVVCLTEFETIDNTPIGPFHFSKVKTANERI